MASFFKKLGRSLGKIGAGAAGGFLMGGPLGALAGGAMGGMQKGGLNFRNILKSGGMGALGGLGTGALLGGAGLSGIPGLGMLSGGGMTGGMSGLFGGGGGMGSLAMKATGFGSPGVGGGGGVGLGNIARSVLGTGQGMFGTSVNPLQLAQGILGYSGARQQEKRVGGIQDVQMGLLGQGKELAGLSPEARKLMLERAKEQIRASQAERGIYQSGPAAAFEAEQLPLIEAQMNQMALENLLRTSQSYGNLYGGGGYQ